MKTILRVLLFFFDYEHNINNSSWLAYVICYETLMDTYHQFYRICKYPIIVWKHHYLNMKNKSSIHFCKGSYKHILCTLLDFTHFERLIFGQSGNDFS